MDAWLLCIQRFNQRVSDALSGQAMKVFFGTFRELALSWSDWRSWRESLNPWSFVRDHPKLVFGLAVILALVVYQFVLSGNDRRGLTKAYYFDIGTGEVFVASARFQPPIPAPSGSLLGDGAPAGVRAEMFACGDCGDPSARFVGYLDRLSPDHHKAALNGEVSALPDGVDFEGYLQDGWLVASPDRPEHWVKLTSDEGAIIVDAPHEKCGDTVVRRCLPE